MSGGLIIGLHTRKKVPPFTCHGRLPVLKPTGCHRSGEWSIYQNVHYFIRSKNSVL